VSRPEESSQPVFKTAGHNVYVKVRHTLADAIIDTDKSAMSIEALFDCPRQELGVMEYRRDQFLRQVDQRFIVSLRDK
jgi:hypothetical protein